MRPWTKCRLAACAFLLSVLNGWPAEINGRVVDAQTGEAVARVAVRCGLNPPVSTDDSGRFRVEVEGSCELRAAAVGYRPATQTVAAGAEVEIRLLADTLRKESLDVSAGPFAVEAATSVSLAGAELRNLASVLADDPLRAVQSLPGVTSNDDFQSQFAIRGAGFQRIGIYVDGILLHAPFHTVQGDPNSASLTAFQGEILESANLHEGALPVRFADRTAGALDFRTREGNQQRFAGRFTASASNAGASVEGPWGRRVNWLAAIRKSYLQYLVERTTDEPSIAFGFWDTQQKVSWKASERHQFGATLLHSQSALDRSENASRFGLNTLVTSDYRYTLGYLSWRYAGGPRFFMSQRGGYLRERYTNRNRDSLRLQSGAYGEWIWNGEATRQWGENSFTEFGGSVRRIRDDGYFNRVFSPPVTLRRIDDHRGTGLRSGFFAQQSWSPVRRVQFVAGARFDRYNANQRSTVSPYGWLNVGLWNGGKLSAGWGQAAQFPELSVMGSRGAGSFGLLPERATQMQVGIEQNIGLQTRVRLEFFNRQDRDLLFQPLAEPRLVDGRVYVPPQVTTWRNSQRGYARGMQIFVQRRSANKVTGWISYAYVLSRVRDGAAAITNPMDFDLRHSVTAYASWRFRPLWNLSGRYAYGTGLPVRGFFEERTRGEFFLSSQRNQLRLPDYQRLDLRINKAWSWRKAQLTLFAEVVNVTNRENVRFNELSGYDVRTGRARISFETMLPVLPSAGIVVDF